VKTKLLLSSTAICQRLGVRGSERTTVGSSFILRRGRSSGYTLARTRTKKLTNRTARGIGDLAHGSIRRVCFVFVHDLQVRASHDPHRLGSDSSQHSLFGFAELFTR
jgi:hypothetical protein